MFVCHTCSVPCGPKVSPILTVVETRATQYEYQSYDPIQDEKVTQFSVGSEIVKEIKECPACAGLELTREPNVSYAGFQAITRAMQEHGRKCKERMVVDCHVCLKNVAKFSSFPLPAISFALCEPRAPRFTQSLAAVVVEKLQDKARERSKRASQDCTAAAQVLAPYQRRGGGL